MIPSEPLSPLNPVKLLQDSTSQIGQIYLRLLFLALPQLVWGFTVPLISSQVDLVVMALLYFVLFRSWTWIAAISYTYEHFKHRRTTLGKAFQQGIERAIPLILGSILFAAIFASGLILLIIPGIYCVIRLFFFKFLIVLEDCSPTAGLRQSWRLVRGRWWQVFWAVAFETLVFDYFVSHQIDQAIRASAATSPAYATVLSTVLVFLINPVIIGYEVLLFIRLQKLRNTERSADD